MKHWWCSQSPPDPFDFDWNDQKALYEEWFEHLVTQQVDNMVDNCIQRASAAYQHCPDVSSPSNTGRSSNSNSRGRSSSENAGSGKKRKLEGKDKYCLDFGKMDHLREESISKEPSFQSKKRR